MFITVRAGILRQDMQCHLTQLPASDGQ